MERKVVFKWLRLVGLGFTLVSVIEIIDLLLLSSTIEINLESQQLNLFELFFFSGMMPIHGIFLFIFLLIVPFCFTTLSLAIFKIAKDEMLDNRTLSKFIFIIGMVLLLGNFVKLEYIILLSKTELNVSLPISFQLVLYDPTTTPFIGAVLWIFPIGVVCGFLISGLIFGGVGLKWILLLENEQITEEKISK